MSQKKYISIMSGFVPSTSALGANPDIEATESKYNYPTV
jgi:hypothetical protein